MGVKYAILKSRQREKYVNIHFGSFAVFIIPFEIISLLES